MERSSAGAYGDSVIRSLACGLRLCPVVLAFGCASSTSVQDQISLVVPEGVTVDVTESTYAVFGRTIPDIWDSLNERGPAVDNRIVSGAHSWRLTWDMRLAHSGAQCRADGLEIVMGTEITVPDWRQRVGSDPEVQNHWEEFARRIRVHEEQHREYALEAVRDLREAILAVRAPDCETVRQRIESQTNLIMDRYNALNRAFDRRDILTWPPGG